MQLLIKNVRIIDPRSSWHEQTVDLFIHDGKIEEIGSGLSPSKDAELLEGDNLHLSPGWFDLGAYVGEPGFEHRETITSLQQAAARGGYTGLAVLPNTYPIVDTKSQVRYIIHHSQKGPVELFPLAAISEDCKGKDITEMIDMHHAGAVGFSDGVHSIDNAGLMLRALQYVKTFDGLILNHPFEQNVMPDGQIHEGLISTELGLRGIPTMAETLMVARDLNLLNYAESRLHLLNISCRESVQRIREAIDKGARLSASVPVMNLIFEDKDLEFFDTNLKVLPPLRAEEDRKALVEALVAGHIEVITSNHMPWDTEAKDLEFPNAEFGAIGLETTFALLRTFLKDQLDLSRVIEALAIAPRELLGIQTPRLEVGQEANLTVFDPEVAWKYKVTASRSRNTPFMGASLNGKAIALINRKQFIRV